jgi:hypothetical protein
VCCAGGEAAAAASRSILTSDAGRDESRLLCLAHIADAAVEPSDFRGIEAALGAAFEYFHRVVNEPDVAWLPSSDLTDALLCARLHETMGDEREEARTASALDDLEARLMLDHCPICAPLARAEGALLDWVATEHCRDDVGLGRELNGVCGRHVVAVAARSDDVVHSVISRVAGERAERAERGRALVAAVRPARRDHARTLPILERVLSGRDCKLCVRLSAFEARQRRLLEIGLHDPIVRATYAEARGLCINHLSASDLRTDKLAARVARRALARSREDLAGALVPDASLDAATVAAAVLRAACVLDGRVAAGASISDAMPLLAPTPLLEAAGTENANDEPRVAT